MNEHKEKKISDILKSAIEKDYKKLRETFTFDPYYAIQILIRRLDVISMFFWSSSHQSEDQINESRAYFEFGWCSLLKLFLNDHNFDLEHHFIQTFQSDYKWADSVIIQSGKLAFCLQLLEYEKANAIEFDNPKINEFSIKHKDENIGLEYFERVSFDFYCNQVLKRMIDERKANLPFSEDEIKTKLRSIIKNPYGNFISYETTPEIDEYYNELGKQHCLAIHGYDDFDLNDKFGSIEYWKYLDLVETICGVALMHTQACIELTKMNSEVDMHNLLTYMYFKDKTIKIYSNYFGVDDEEIEQILSCLTLSKDNYEYHLDIPATSPPMYFQVSENQLIRSVAGCVGNPFRFLNNELKRKYKKDYDIAVNNREERFRKDLFGFFPHERIIKIPKEINISFGEMRTDIDAVAYDTETKTLGLFQLKWQDPFAHSMKERFSKISNLFPKAHEWIGKIETWLSNNDIKTILNSLQITKFAPQAREINNICVFVIARNHIHFSRVKTDERVAWGSWYQIIESTASIETKLDDPIKEMFVRLKFSAPEHRMNREEMPERQHFEAKIGDYRVSYAKEDDLS